MSLPGRQPKLGPTWQPRAANSSLTAVLTKAVFAFFGQGLPRAGRYPFWGFEPE